MGLDKISLQNFRSYEKRTFSLGRKTVVMGENGSGKSNLMEAVYLLAIGKSFRADYEQEMVAYGENFFRVIGEIGEVGEIGVEMIENRKRFLINGVPRRMVDFVGRVRAVLFCPQDMELVTGSPGGRRRYLDFVISQMDREYRRCLISYEKGLRQRNKLLSLIRDGMAQHHQLFFWDKLLIKNGEYINIKRGEYLVGLEEERYSVFYDKSVISEVRLKQYEMEEVAAAATLVGPHRDDFQVLLNGRDVSKYGSRGEQRMAVLWLKKREIKYLENRNEKLEAPVLLLDDIFSELDHKHREEVKKMVEGYLGQVIMTTADRHLLPENSEDTIIEL